ARLPIIGKSCLHRKPQSRPKFPSKPLTRRFTCMPGKKNVPMNEQDNVLQDDFLDTPVEGEEDWMAEAEGQLAVDVYQTKENVVIKAPIAGVTPDKIDIEVAEDVVTIRGERVEEKEVDREHYY